MKHLLATAAALLFAFPAFATGFVTPPAESVVVPAEQTWTGLYGGVQYDGYAVMEEHFDGFGFVSDYEAGLTGFFGGFRNDFGSYVLGIEVDVMSGTFERGTVAPGVIVTDQDAEADLVRVGAEVGYDLGDVLVYGAAGFATLHLDYGNAFPLDGNGVFYGLGVDYRLNDRITIGAELLQHDFTDFPDVPIVQYEVTTFGVNLAFTF